MCLILFAWRSHPQYKLLVAANRDEFYVRPTEAAHFWKDAPHILAGRDLEQGGTWLGVTTSRRFAALTNVRNPHAPLGQKSRGLLVSDYLNSNEKPEKFLQRLQPDLANYSPFNLLTGDSEHLYYSNSVGVQRELQPGIYGLSNAALDTAWPKVTGGKQALAIAMMAGEIKPEQLFNILANTEKADAMELPDTGVGIELEKQLSARFIHMDTYGTRCSTVVTQSSSNEMYFLEKQFDEKNIATKIQSYYLAVPK
jgi:uncharacterized protein with NRDE domain